MDDLIHETYMHAPIGVVLAERRIVRVANHAFAEMFGYTVEECIGASMAKFYFSHEEYERVGAAWQQAFQVSPTYDDIRIMKRADGSLFWVRGRGRSLTPEDPFASGIWSYADLSQGLEVIQLTARERDVAMELVQGRSAKEIARSLDISPRTAETHRARLMKKYNVRTSAQLIARLASVPIAQGGSV